MNTQTTLDAFPAPRLALIIPAYNEQDRIASTLSRVIAYLAGQPYRSEVVVVDDGSTDETARIVQTRFPTVHLIRYDTNRGKGFAVKYGMMTTAAEFAVLYDADGATPIDELESIWPEFTDGADVVVGSRNACGAKIDVRQPAGRILMGRVYNRLLRTLGITTLSDTQCGFKAFNARARQLLFPLQRVEHFGFDAEILYIAERFGLDVREVPVRWSDSKNSRVRPGRDSLRMLRDAIRLRLRRDLPSARAAFHSSPQNCHTPRAVNATEDKWNIPTSATPASASPKSASAP